MRLSCLPFIFSLSAMIASSWTQAGNVSISNVPLGTGSGISVKPNLMFILDDSGSMGSEFMPDYVDDNQMCPDADNDGDLDNKCVTGDPPFSSSEFNTIYYNPAIRYWPPKNADGSDWTNASTITPEKEPFDGYGETTGDSTATQELTKYQNTAWCKLSTNTPSGNPATDTNCKYYPVGSASAYPLYPDTTYKYRKTYNGPPVYHVMSGLPQWCKESALTTCQSRWTSTYKYPKWGSAAATTGVQASRSFYIVQAGNTSGTRTIDIKYNGASILTSPISVSYSSNKKNNRNDLATKIIDAINNSSSGFSAVQIRTDSGGNTCSTTTTCAQIKVTAPGSATSTVNADYNKSFDLEEPTGIDFNKAVESLSGGVNYLPAATGVSFTRYQIVSGQTYTKYAGRDDCVGTSCTYEEELQNFANWYSFYRKRMLMTKTAVSRAFGNVTDTAPGAGFRIGLMMISSGAPSDEIADKGDTTCWTANKDREVAIADFNPTQKSLFYKKFFNTKTCSYTPLRGALSRAGRLFSHTLDDGTVHDKDAYDPVQFSCQQNFSFLSTDGYWNDDIEGGSFGPYKTDGTTKVADQDGAASRPMKDALSKQDTLADVAMYYYTQDLRSDMQNDVPTSSKDSATYQHMVTFTMGLGVDGTLVYSPDYEQGGSSDYTAIVQGTKDWTDPSSSGPARIDDLWHAAVNGRGKYFSASNPDTVATSLQEALLGVSAMTGSSAAAATSNLEPVAGDNYAYVASYVTQTWEGNLQAREIDLVTGSLAATPIWEARSLLDAKAAVTTVPTGASGPGSRKLYSFNSSATTTDKKFLLTWANVAAQGWSSYFDPAQLNQCSPMSFCPGATNENLFTYLAGGADTTTNGSYRERTHILGDIVNSQPVYVKTPSFTYSDDGYSTFKSGATRKAMVYVGANDGFLHAFDANTGEEDWAYMPKLIAPSLYELASSNYPHRYYVDGVLAVGDVKIGSNWKTVLVGGLAGGGKGYYALDVTDPTNPLALWEFSDTRMGYSFGNPVITKLPEGTTSSSGSNISGKWVVLVTAGYNNGTSLGSHDGQGILYVLDVYSGTEYFRIYTCSNQSDDTTCAGNSASPLGLAKINNWVDNPSVDNTTKYVYGGDLEGNLWRFDPLTKSAFKVAEIGEPITIKPELAEIQSKRVIYFGTGIFLQASDKADRARRSIYAIKDDPLATGPLSNVKTSGDVVEQVLTASADGNTRSMSASNAVDWNTKSGCFVELLEDGERVNVDPKIQLGTIVVASNVPDETTASSCSTGGHSWLNFLDATNCAYVVNNQSNPDEIASVKLANALAVGINIVKLPNGKLITITTTSDNQHPVKETPVGTASLPMRRVSWREIVTD